MGYVIVPPQYIKGEGCNHHIFEFTYNKVNNKIKKRRKIQLLTPPPLISI